MCNDLPDPCNLSELLNNYEVIIPILQRDYAQGRTDKRTVDIRNRFLNTLKEKAHSDTGITLDFVYGEINKEKGVFTPLDGQQRLTTLLLLHWYAAKRNLFDIEKDILKKFTYRTHPSARLFYKNLVEHTAELPIEKGKKISVQIQNHTSWWITKWKDDPTIIGMLTMLDAIHEVFADDTDHLHLDKINFHLINISTYGLTDDIYIKMNSRSLPLTPFERIKGAITDDISDISMKFDREWTNMLWKMLPAHDENSGQTLDNYFLNYIRYVCDTYLLTCGKKSARILNDYGMIHAALNPDENAPEKDFRTYLEERFDMWREKDQGNGIAQLFADYLCTKRRDDGHQLTVDGIFDTSNLFRACCEGYSDTNDSYETKIKFKNSQVIMLYAFETYLLQHEPDKIDKNEFLTRLRWVRNLVWNSDLSNKLPALLKETESIICFGLPEEVKAFNNEQLKQEKEKEAWLNDKQDEDKKAFYALEDHSLIRGDISVVRAWKDPKKCKRFCDLFQMEGDNIKDCKLLTRALLSMGPIWSETGSWNGHERDRVTIMSRNQFVNCSQDERTIFALDQLLNEEKLNSTYDIKQYLDSYNIAEYRHRMEKYTATHQYGKDDIGDDWNYYFVKYSIILDRSYQGYFVWRNNDIYAITGKRATSGNHFWDIILLGIEAAVGADNVKCQDNADHYSTAGKLQIDGKYLMHREVRESKAYFCIADTEGHPVSALPIGATQDCVQQGASIVQTLLSNGPAGLPQLAEGEVVDGGAEGGEE